MAKCTICGGEMDVDGRCERCYGVRCRICSKPLYRDESRKSDAFGVRHLRCARRAVARPREMKPVTLIGRAVE